jgi:Type II secretion system (T2SS), protein G
MRRRLRVHFSKGRQPSRYLALSIVAGLHLVAIMLFALHDATRVRHVLPHEQAPEFFVSFPEFGAGTIDERSPPEPDRSRSTTARSNAPAPPAERVRSSITAPSSQSRAIHEPPIDWSMELKRSSQALLDREEDKARREAMFGGHPEVPEGLRPPPPGGEEFAWSYRARRFEGGVVRINEHCALILGLIPVCQIGKIPVRGELFLANMQKAKAADQLAYSRSRSLAPVDRETRLELQAISRLLGEWRARRGSYPDDLTQLVAQSPAAAQTEEGRMLIVDAWEHKVVYRHPSTGSVCDYDLYSLGPDGVDDHGTRDDIVSCGSTPELSY